MPLPVFWANNIYAREKDEPPAFGTHKTKVLIDTTFLDVQAVPEGRFLPLLPCARWAMEIALESPTHAGNRFRIAGDEPLPFP